LRIARDAGVLTLREPRPRRGLNAAVGYATALARRRGARRVLVLPADLPLLAAGVVRRLATKRWDGRRLTLVPDRANTGTNVMLATRRHTIGFQFGPGSFSKHRVLVGRGELAVCRMPELMLDVDTVDDLCAWRHMSNGIVRAR
jgi:2-phospho-L-lactate guanylyltransferase